MNVKNVSISIDKSQEEDKINMKVEMKDLNFIVNVDLQYSEAMNIAVELLARCPFELLDTLGDDLAERATKIAMEQQ